MKNKRLTILLTLTFFLMTVAGGCAFSGEDTREPSSSEQESEEVSQEEDQAEEEPEQQ